MSPTLNDGDYIIAIKSFKNAYHPQDIIIARHPQYGEIVKRIKAVDDQGKYWLIGDGSDTLSSEKMGALSEQYIIAKMRWHISP